MAWNGWFEYDGNEVINVTRTETYAKNAGAGWFRPAFENDALPYMLGDGLRYASALIDEAPWVDDNRPESIDFWGVYPLEITGLEDSTRGSTVVESLIDGGTPGRIRHATKTIVFNCVLIGANEAAVSYGVTWLRQALLGGACGTPVYAACNGADLCFLSSSPDMELPTDADAYRPGFDPEECLLQYQRQFRKVIFNTGPTVTSKRETNDGGAVWTVTFSCVAGNPFEIGAEVPIIKGFLDPEVVIPWANGVEPDGGMIDLNGNIFEETDCATATYQPIYDPLYPAMVPPPEPPSVPLGNYSPPLNWQRRQFTIPKQFVPGWGEVVPKIDVHAIEDDARTLRLRFYADPFDVGDISDDPCAYCGDIVISYVPVDHTLTLDGSDQTVYITAPGGQRQRADSLVFKTNGTPFEWPALSCGFGYIVTVDLPQTQIPPVIDLSLFPRTV